MKYPESVKMVEVGPRDGLQNEQGSVPTEVKVELIDRLSDAGLPVGRGRQLRFAEMGAADGGHRGSHGAHPAQAWGHLSGAGAEHERAGGGDRRGRTEVAGFAAATEAFSKAQHQLHDCRVACSARREVCKAALDAGVRVRGYISVVLGCPYEGEVNRKRLPTLREQLYDMGCYEISLGDTIGTGTPAQAQRMIEAVAQDIPVEKLAGHFHDTYGQALANILAVMEMGVATFDSSVAGLGGCPYAKGATGNVASEDVLYMLGRTGHRNRRGHGRAARCGRIHLRASRAADGIARRPCAGRETREGRGVNGMLQGHPFTLCQCLPDESVHRAVPRLLSHARRNRRLARFFRRRKTCGAQTASKSAAAQEHHIEHRIDAHPLPASSCTAARSNASAISATMVSGISKGIWSIPRPTI